MVPGENGSVTPRLSYDIFCRVIDNFGDAGVCWRLACQLASHPQAGRVRLWIDNLHRLAAFVPHIDPHAQEQQQQGVNIRPWTAAQSPGTLPGDVVIEAFGCDLPPSFRASMGNRTRVWLNLEYLSAEAWVDSCHALPSRQPDGTDKYFFFPGFTPATGGLLREPGLLAQRDQWRRDINNRLTLLDSLGVPADALARLQGGALQVLLFAYPHAPADALVHALNQHAEGAVILVPEGVCPALERRRFERVQVYGIPFVSQPVFDQLLWGSDLNCVRGEDSVVRALWAGKPMLWHIYPQTDDTHLEKLHAWLDRSPYSAAVRQRMLCWNADPACPPDRIAPLSASAWADWQREAALWSAQLAGQPDLVSSLTAFCAAQVRKG
jgi:uncharacterized repeat protein (TIGR03837 family)